MRSLTTRRTGPSTGPPPTRADWFGLAVGAIGAGVMLSPLRHYARPPLSGRDAPKFTRDSFPLSTFPMFSEARGRSTYVPHVVGYTADGDRVIPSFVHFGPGGLNQVRRQVSRAVRRGEAVRVAQAYADSLAQTQAQVRGSVASAAGRRRERRRQEACIEHVEVVRSRFRFEEYYAGLRRPHRETVHAVAPVGGVAQAVQQKRTASQAAETYGARGVEEVRP